MADFKLGRLKFVWKGPWTTATAYVKDDIVEYNGQGWVCEKAHTSADFATDRDAAESKWTKMSEGFSWKGPWQVGTSYEKNAVVSYLASTWISLSDNNQGNPPLVLPATVDPNWQLYAPGYDLSYVDQDILPSADGLYDIGSPSLRFKDLYMTGNSIFLGPAKIEADGASVTITNGDGTKVIFADGGFAGGDVIFSGNTVTTVESNADLELDAAGTGKVVALTNMEIQGDLDVTGSITLGGNITIGDTPVDTVTVQADFTSDIIPDASLTYDLGSTGQRWNNLYINKINDLLFDRVEGQTYYVTQEGDDLEPGTSVQGAFATLAKALTVAVAGDTIKVGAGTFTEVFPLTVPAGVSIVGLGIRATKIVPTVGTNNKDAFLLEGESGIVDLTVADFFYDSIGDTGYAFRFKTNAVITTRSPYIERVTVLCRGSSPSASDPYGFLTGDAGRGALVDGAQVTRASLEAAMLFNECTFIVPNSRALIMKNGARVEWLTCFTYFADLAIEGVVGAAGRGGDGKTYITLSGTTGTWNVGNTLSYYDNDGVTVLASGAIEAINGSTYQLDGSVAGFITNTNRDNKPITVNGDAKLSNLQQKFGSTSLLLDGTDDFLTIASNADFGYGTGDFTIDMWVYRTVSGVDQILLDQRTASPTNYAPVLAVNTSNALVYLDGAGIVITGSTTVPLNAWSHIAVSRSGTDTKLFLNGVQQGATYTDTRNYIATPIRIGARFDGTLAFTGHIDELRISKGVARYTSAFTPSTSAFTGDSDTVLLLHFDGANLSTNIVDDGITIQDIRSSAGGTATGVVRYDRKEFAAELRSISSANIYGNQGAKADGADVKLQLMAHNFAYIGTGADLTNDDTAVVQANEVIEANGGKVYYNSVDQSGNFRVGEFFSVDFETGAVTFAAGNFDVSSLVGINFTDGSNTTIVDPTQVTTGNLTLAGNSLTSSTGDITIDPSGNEDIILNADVSVTGNLDVGGNITLAGNIVIGDTPVDTVTVQADFTSNLIPDVDQTYDLGTAAKQWRTIHVDQLDNGQISIKDNRVVTTESNTNLEIDTAGTGTIELQSNTNVTGILTASNGIGTPASGTTVINNNLDIDLDLNVDGGNLTTNQTTFNLVNANATTVNFAGAATSIFIGESTGTTTVRNSLQVNGNLIVQGTTTAVNSNTVTIDDKNLELASVAAVTGITGTITSSATTTTVTDVSSVTGLIIGQTVTATGGTGVFGTGAVIASIDSDTQITVTSSTASTAGTVTFNAGGATDITADGGGITVKGTTDKTFSYDNANLAWTSSESINVVTGKGFEVNGVEKLTATTLFSQEATATIGAPLSTITFADSVTITNELNALGDILGTQIEAQIFPAFVETLDIGLNATALTLGGDSGKTTVQNTLEVLLDVNTGGNVHPILGINTFESIAAGPPSTSQFGFGLLLNVDIEFYTGAILDVRIASNGELYQNGEVVTLSGASLGGTSPENDLTITIVDATAIEFDPDTGAPVAGGGVTTITWAGLGAINTPLNVVELMNIGATEILFGGQATNITMGSALPGSTNINHDLSIKGDLRVMSEFTGADGNLFSDALVFNILPDNVTTINIGTFANTINIGTSFTEINLLGQVNIGTSVGNFKGSFFGDDSSVIINGITGDITANDLLVIGQTTLSFDLAVNGGDITTDQTTFNLLNDVVETLNLAQAATTITIGAETGTLQIRNANLQADGDLAVLGGNITTSSTTFNFVTTGASTVNLATSAETIGIGSSLGTTTVNNNLAVTGNISTSSDTLSSSNVNFNLLNTDVTTVNAFGAATIVNIGEATGTTTIASAATILDGDLTVKGGDIITDQTEFNLINSTATTVNFAGAASAVNIGAGTGVTTIRQDLDLEDNLNIQGGNITTPLETFNFVNTTALTVNIAGDASQVNIGNQTGATNINHSLNVAGLLTLGSSDSTVARIDSVDTTFYLTNTFVENLYMGGAATLVEIGSSTGTTTIKNGLVVNGATSLDSTLEVKGSSITTNQSTFNLINDTATTINFGSAGTAIHIGASTGTTTIKNDIVAEGDIDVQGGDITTNQSTFNLVNGNATTVNFAGGASTVNIGASTGTVVVGDALTVTGATTVGGSIIPDTNIAYDLGSADFRFRDLYLAGNTIDLAGGTISFDGTKFNFQGGTNVGSSVDTTSNSFDLLNEIAQTINFGGDAFTINMGNPQGGTTNIKHDLQVFGTLIVGAEDSGTTNITGLDTTANLFNTTVETLNFAGAATSIQIGSAVGTTTVNHNLTVDGTTTVNQDLVVSGNLTLTSLNTSGENNDFVISPQGTGRVIIEPAGGLIVNPGTTGNINNTNIGATVRGTGAFTTLAANGQVNFTGGISSVDATTGTVVITGGLAISENINIEGNISGNSLTLRGTPLFENELAVPSGGTGVGQFAARGVLYGNSTDPIQATDGSDYENPYTGTNQQTSFAVLTTTAQGVPVWTDIIDGGTY